MNKQDTGLQGLREKLPLLVYLLCVVQPFLDIAGYWQQTLGVGNTVTMALRMLLLGGTVLAGFLLSRRKRSYLITAAVLLLLTAGHVLACTRRAGGYKQPLSDIINLVRIYFLPLMTICFISFLQANRKVFPALMKGMVTDLLLIAAVQLLSALSGTDPHTYAADRIGILGWFLWTNSQSAILTMLTPMAVCWALRRWKQKLLPIILTAAVSEATLFVLAPRLAYASLVAAGLGMAFCLLLTDRRRWKQSLALVLVTCLFVAAYPISPTRQRLSANTVRASQTEEFIQEMDIVIDIVTEPVSTPAVESSAANADQQEAVAPKPSVRIDDENAKKLEQLYRSQNIIWSMVDRFGRDKVFEIYNYTLDPTILSNTRLMKIHFCELLMEESGVLSRFFGLNLNEMLCQRYNSQKQLTVDNYDVENDLHGVYFLLGWVGLALMLLFLLYFGLRALVAVLHNPRRYFKLPMAAFAIAYGLGMIHAYYTASVLRRNNASFYLSVVLAGLWYLSRKNAEEDEIPSA